MVRTELTVACSSSFYCSFGPKLAEKLLRSVTNKDLSVGPEQLARHAAAGAVAQSSSSKCVWPGPSCPAVLPAGGPFHPQQSLSTALSKLLKTMPMVNGASQVQQ